MVVYTPITTKKASGCNKIEPITVAINMIPVVVLVIISFKRRRILYVNLAANLRNQLIGQSFPKHHQS